LELDAHELGKEVVEAVPLASVVEGHEEQVRARERVEEPARALLLEHRVAQWAGQPLEDRATKHERLRRGIVCFEHLVHEEIDHVTAAAAERAREGAPVLCSL